MLIGRRRLLVGLLVAAGSPPLAPAARSQVSGQRPPQTAPKSAAWLTLPPTPALPAAARSGLAAVNGTEIFFAQFGAGPPVLMLHGGLGHANHWAYQVGELAKHFTVIIMDTRGH